MILTRSQKEKMATEEYEMLDTSILYSQELNQDPQQQPQEEDPNLVNQPHLSPSI